MANNVLSNQCLNMNLLLDLNQSIINMFLL